MQTISQTPFDLNNDLFVRYSGHGLNNEPFDERTVLDHLNTKLVRYSDPHCTVGKDAQNSETFENWTFTCLIFKWLK